jgi:hypothetical protein
MEGTFLGQLVLLVEVRVNQPGGRRALTLVYSLEHSAEGFFLVLMSKRHRGLVV